MPMRPAMPAPALAILHGGDRYLAANVEAVRVTAASLPDTREKTRPLALARQQIARLNPCHEDNYYLANGLLAWSGAVEDSNRILQAALECRFWDEVPLFLHAINLVIFQHDRLGAAHRLEAAARRVQDNASALHKMAIVLRSESIGDTRLALDYLIGQRDSAREAGLRNMLEKRITRLHGLQTLRDAQSRYESRHGPLQRLQQLVEHGLLERLPHDPLHLGYQLSDDRIVLNTLELPPMEQRP
ncbi:hypothetical protein [Stutzerimonas kirkiae]|uniref:hypothetical protein n=1 Tax=Stutzerimonas kirkiae TaxID=2211392 RepID=UPI001F6253F6|nr:hypothetical protein [Stutzerimonas kirkiae]